MDYPRQVKEIIDQVTAEVGPLSVKPPSSMYQTNESSPIASYIDHTRLSASATTEEIDMLCEQAKKYGFASVCVNPCWAERVTETLRDTTVASCSVVGFPLGATETSTKVQEASLLQGIGCKEVDIVANIGWIKEKRWKQAFLQLRSILSACPRAVTKVIVECGALTEEEIIASAILVLHSGAHFIKTSTGFGPRGATVEDIQLLAKVTLGSHLRIKASGGIRDYVSAKKLLHAGAHRIGTSSSLAIIDEEKAQC